MINYFLNMKHNTYKQIITAIFSTAAMFISLLPVEIQADHLTRENVTPTFNVF